MPYLIMKRSDLPAGLVQITDLLPNTSQRNLILDPPGQSGYCRAVQNDAPRLNTNGGVITFRNYCEGLAAWFLTNINDGTGDYAFGTIETPAKASLLDNEVFVISDGVTAVTFAFHVTGAYVPVPGEVEVNITTDVTATQVRDRMLSAINGVVGFGVLASTSGLDTVNLANQSDGTAGNVLITTTVADGGFIVAGMADGVDADAITRTNAVNNAALVLALVGYDDPLTSPGVVDMTAINFVLSVGSVTSGQADEIRRILAGETYQVPAGTQIQAASAFNVSPAVGATGGPGFVDGTRRNIYDTGALRASLDVGVLSKYADPTFTYGNITDTAVVVYNDDGTLFTP